MPPAARLGSRASGICCLEGFLRLFSAAAGIKALRSFYLSLGWISLQFESSTNGSFRRSDQT